MYVANEVLTKHAKKLTPDINLTVDDLMDEIDIF